MSQASEDRRKRAGLKAVEKVSVAAELAESNANPSPRIVTLSNGAELRMKPVPPLVFRQIAERIPEVPVPEVFLEDRGRVEPNPNDPDYLKAVEKRLYGVFAEFQNAMFVLGVEVVSPGTCLPMEEDDWLDQLELVGIHPNVSNRFQRQLSWLTNVALVSEVDIAYVVQAITRLSGVTEIGVLRAAHAFRGDEERGADRDPAAEATG